MFAKFYTVTGIKRVFISKVEFIVKMLTVRTIYISLHNSLISKIIYLPKKQEPYLVLICMEGLSTSIPAGQAPFPGKASQSIQPINKGQAEGLLNWQVQS